MKVQIKHAQLIGQAKKILSFLSSPPPCAFDIDANVWVTSSLWTSWGCGHLFACAPSDL